MTKYKYPRTVHHPLSQSITDDDKILKNDSNFINKNVVITLKLDGENFTGGKNYCHARSLDSINHPSRDWAKTFHFNNIAPNLPDGYRYVAENLYACHSIYYDNLTTYLYGFQMWNEEICLSWKETLEWFSLLNITPVPIVYEGIYSLNIVKELFNNLNKEKDEGLVIIITDSFTYDAFKNSVCKLVRANHVQPNEEHWMHKQIIPNKLII